MIVTFKSMGFQHVKYAKGYFFAGDFPWNRMYCIRWTDTSTWAIIDQHDTGLTSASSNTYRIAGGKYEAGFAPLRGLT